MAYYRTRSGGKSSPGAWMIFGAIVMTLALVLAGYVFFSHLDWVEVHYEAQDIGCSTHRGAKGRMQEGCAVKYTYTYNGQTYTHQYSDHARTNGIGGKFRIDPYNPNDYSNDKGNYIIAGIIGGLGLVFFLCGFIPAMRRRDD